MTMNVDHNVVAPRVGVIGAGFMAEVHTRAAQAAGARLVGLASSSMDRAEVAARRLGYEGAWEVTDLLGSPDIDVVHVCTPNLTHEELALAAVQAGKTVVCEKPLATSVEGARRLMTESEALGVVAAVPFVYRFHPMVREARARVREGQMGRIFVIQGSYLQDWLMSADDDNWRVVAATGGPSRAFADIGSHLCDLIEFVTDDRIGRVSAVTRTVHAERASTKGVGTEDAVAIAFVTVGGVIGTLLISQVSAGRKNRLSFEISGEHEAHFFDQELPENLWIGRRKGSQLLPRDADLLHPSAARYSMVPSGHPQGYQDAFNAFVADVYATRNGRPAEGLPTFADGYRAAILTEAVLRSHRTATWVEIPDSSLDLTPESYAPQGVTKGDIA